MKNKDMMEMAAEMFAAQTEAEERGEREFRCPLCGGEAHWGRAAGNGHLHIGCRGCGFRMAE